MARKTVGYIVTFNGRPMNFDDKTGLFKYFADAKVRMFGPDERAFVRNAVQRTKRKDIKRPFGSRGRYRIRRLVSE